MTQPRDPRQIKCIVWDLDDTLWRGTLLENPDVLLRPGAAEVLETLDQRGVLHSIASRNHRGDALARLGALGVAEYFVHPQIGWEAKSAAVGRIAERLGVALDSLLFIDDQEYERDEVRSVHPDVSCAPAEALEALTRDPRLIPPVVTDDARSRRRMIQADERRQDDEAAFGGPKETFLAGLGMRLRIFRAGPDDLERARELTLRTNQLNTTGITLEHEELVALSRSPSHELLLCDLEDRYGPYGRIGLALVDKSGPVWRLRLLLMSCRVISRGVGQVLLSCVMKRARQSARGLFVDFRPTERNRMMHVTLCFAGFREVAPTATAPGGFAHHLTELPPYPRYVEVVEPEGLDAASPEPRA